MKVFAIEMIKASGASANPQQPPLQFEGADLRGAQSRLLTARGVCLDNGRLGKINVAGASLEGCSFKNADLKRANFFGCELTKVDFSGADLRGADLRNTVKSNVIMTGANWAKASKPRRSA